MTETEIVKLQEEVAALRARICATCGFTEMQHFVPVPEDWAVDPAAYHCGDFTPKEES